MVVVSCVSSEAPYKPHPHNLVGKEGCSKGVCTIEMDSETMSCTFPSLGIQCVKKKEIEESLSLRQQIFRSNVFGFSIRELNHAFHGRWPTYIQFCNSRLPGRAPKNWIRPKKAKNPRFSRGRCIAVWLTWS